VRDDNGLVSLSAGGLSRTGASLDYASCLSGTAIALASNGDIAIGGYKQSLDFPLVAHFSAP